MSSPPIFFNFFAQVEHVFFQLSSSKFNGFPVVNSAGQPIGIIERDALIQLIKKRAWYTAVTNIEPELPHWRLTSNDINPGQIDTQNSINTPLDDNKLTEDFAPYHEGGGDIDPEDVTEKDERDYPRQQPVLEWEDLNQDFESNPMNYKDIEEIAQSNG